MLLAKGPFPAILHPVPILQSAVSLVIKRIHVCLFCKEDVFGPKIEFLDENCFFFLH